MFFRTCSVPHWNQSRKYWKMLTSQRKKLMKLSWSEVQLGSQKFKTSSRNFSMEKSPTVVSTQMRLLLLEQLSKLVFSEENLLPLILFFWMCAHLLLESKQSEESWLSSSPVTLLSQPRSPRSFQPLQTTSLLSLSMFLKVSDLLVY